MGETMTAAPAATGGRRRRAVTLRRALVVGALVLGGLGLAGVEEPTPVSAAAPVHPTLVSAVPTNRTPHVTDGDVRTVAVAGNTVVLGGNFTGSTDPDGTVFNRSNILAFDKTTGRIRRDWVPQVDGEVVSIVAAPDGQSVYVGGRFNRVDGVLQNKVARLSIADGRPLPFQAGVNGLVSTVALSGDRLYIGGTFTSVQGRTRRFAALNAQTGAVDDDVALDVAGTHRGGDGKIWRIEPSPDGQHLVVVGNFATVNGQARNQVFKVDVNGDGPVTLSSWSTTAFSGFCASFTDYVRDVSYSPTGDYFVIVTTGAKGTGLNGLCDAVSRWAESNTANDVPQWKMYSGGDSHYSVEATGAAIYVGGHFRWTNNPYGTDSLGPGGVGREGISALDPANGLPLSWNPGRDRGHAVWQILATPEGIYVASDTDRIARYLYRGRIAFFPLAGGLPVPQPVRNVLPIQLDQYVPSGTNANRVLTRGYDGGTVPAPTTAVAAASALSGTRAAFVANGVLYTAHSDGTFKARSYDGTTLGAPTTIDLQRMTTFADDLRRMNGIVYDDGRIYYTVDGSSTLYMRYFSTESRVVGAVRFDVATSTGGLSYSQVGGMVLAGGNVYYVDRQAGTLVRSAWRAGGGIEVTGRTTVGAANANGVSWTSSVLFARQGDVPNQPPTASFTSACTGLRCTFDASASTDADGVVTGVAWTFAPGQTGSGTTATHTFSQPGTYTVTATVTDDESATAIATRTVTVADVAPTASFTASCSQGTCSVDASASADADGTIASYDWDFGDGDTAIGSTAVHSYDASGSYTIRLTVTDNRVQTATTTRPVTVTVPVASGSFVGVNGTDSSRTSNSHFTTVPAAVQPGDQLLLFVASNATSATSVTPPAGWTMLASGGTSGSRQAVFARTAVAGDAGSTVTVQLGSMSRASVGVAAYRGLRAVTPAPALLQGYKTPTTTAALGDWVLSWWMDKSATTTDINPPAGVVERRLFVGTGAGHVAVLLGDSGAPVAAGPAGGLTATPTSPVANAMAFTVLLRPTA